MSESGRLGQAGGGCVVRALIAIAVPVVLLVAATGLFLTVFVKPGCGCAATPTHAPGWTPWPISRDQAAETASRLASVSVRDWSYDLTISGRPLIEAQGLTAVAFVDANSGAVLAAVIEDRLPDSGKTLVSSDAARGTAEAFLAGGSISPTGLTETTQLIQRASVAFYDVIWTAPGAARPGLEVLVNPSSGAAFAYRDLRTGLELSVPVIGHKAAMSLAGASSHANHETPNPADQPQPEFMGLDVSLGAADGHAWLWSVSFPHGSVQVDAETGEVWTWN
jgi:hypothetical protein